MNMCTNNTNNTQYNIYMGVEGGGGVHRKRPPVEKGRR